MPPISILPPPRGRRASHPANGVRVLFLALPGDRIFPQMVQYGQAFLRLSGVCRPFFNGTSRRIYPTGDGGMGSGEPIYPARARAYVPPPPFHENGLRRGNTENLWRYHHPPRTPAGVTGSIDGGAGATTWRPNPRDGGMGGEGNLLPRARTRIRPQES